MAPHGTVEPWTIGKNVSSGCILMINQDAIDLYQRPLFGSKVVVLPWRMGFRMSVFINKDSRDG